MFSAEDEKQYDVRVQLPHQELADEFTKQVDAFYALPRKQTPRTEIVFSPSGVTKCARELYYINTNAPLDEQPSIPWRQRLARNGTGVHNVTQDDYLRMEHKLREAGFPVRFRFLQAEIDGEREYQVGDYVVKLRGRCDGQIGLLDDEGNVVEVLLYEKKTKDQRGKLNKIVRDGKPQDDHIAQTTAYALIWGITKTMFEYESLAKPNWGDISPDKPDQKHFVVEANRDGAKKILERLAGVVKSIQEGTLPEAELDKCGFCPFKTQCSRDGGYRG